LASIDTQQQLTSEVKKSSLAAQAFRLIREIKIGHKSSLIQLINSVSNVSESTRPSVRPFAVLFGLLMMIPRCLLACCLGCSSLFRLN